MKNKFLLILFFFIIFNNSVYADKFKFEASKIELIDKDNLLIAYNAYAVSHDKNLEIKAKKFRYKKKLNLLNAHNGEAFIKSNNLKIIFDKLIINEKNFTLEANEKVEIYDFDNDFSISTENIFVDRKNEIISSNSQSILKDKFYNKIITEKFEYDKSKNIIKIFKANLKDIDNNNFYVDNAQINTKSNHLIGKDIFIKLNNLTFNKDNEPRLKGRSINFKNGITEINKGIFTACKKTDKCPPWQLSAEKITHNKSKKKIDYENVWLKIYDLPVVYFPKFFHPDPTVKRQSGFLMPSFKNSANNETFLSIPYFKILDDSKDLTFTPRFYAKSKQLFQLEYREAKKNGYSISDLSLQNENNDSFRGHFFYNSSKNIKLENFTTSNISLNIEHVSNDTYLRANKLKSPMIKNYDVLESTLGIDLISEDLSIETDFMVFENLNRDDTDRFEYIFPKIDINKRLSNKTNLDGEFNFKSKNYIQNYNTNIDENVNINDLVFRSTPEITKKGFYNNYEFILRNTNSNSKNSSNFKENNNYYMSGLFQFNSSLPLLRDMNDYTSIMKPKIALKISPSYTKDISNKDNRVDVNNIFNIDRISSNDTLEGGLSLTYGNDFMLRSKKNRNEVLNFKIANNLRIKENDDLPKNNQLGSKTSNFFSEIKYTPNKFLTTSYNASTKNNFYEVNYENFSTKISINNFVTTFDYLNENNSSENISYLLNKTTYDFNDSNLISFSTRENKKTNLTEYYNLIYQYKNDCLRASIEYNKEYYDDRDIKPEESIFFKLSIMPFGQTSTPNLIK